MFAEKTRRGTLRFGEYSQEGIGTGHGRTVQLLGKARGALNHTLKCSRRLGVSAFVDRQSLQLVVEMAGQLLPQHAKIGLAGPYQRGCNGVVLDQGEQEMLQRRVLMLSLIGVDEGSMQRRIELGGISGSRNVGDRRR